MGQQQTFASEAWGRKGKVTRRERFLAEMDAVVPWSALVALIGPYCPEADREQLPNLYAVRHRLLPPEAPCAL